MTVRVFLEVGPGGHLASLIDSILSDRPHVAVALDFTDKPGIPALLHGLARLFVAGVPIRLERLTADRLPRRIDLAKLPHSEGPEPSPSSWLVNGTRHRPIHGPEPPRLGQAIPRPETGRNGCSANPIRFESHSVVGNGQGRRHEPLGVVAPLTQPGGSDQVVLAFQENMRKFLEIQKETMLGYLAGRGSLRASPPSPQTGHHPSAEQRDEPASFSNGTRVTSAQDASAPSVIDRSSIAACLVKLVQERTGYPAEMLRLDLDLEADLGIDSIKRVEILGSFRDVFPATCRRDGFEPDGRFRPSSHARSHRRSRPESNRNRERTRKWLRRSCGNQWGGVNFFTSKCRIRPKAPA